MSYRERPKPEREVAVRMVVDWQAVRSPSVSPWEVIGELQRLNEELAPPLVPPRSGG